jgi:hypothetical protein
MPHHLDDGLCECAEVKGRYRFFGVSEERLLAKYGLSRARRPRNEDCGVSGNTAPEDLVEVF